MLPHDKQRLENIIAYCRQIEHTVMRYGNSLERFQSDVDYQQSITSIFR